MNSRERVLCALNHEEPDRVPLFVGTSGVTSLLGEGYERLKMHLGVRGAPSRWLSRPLQYAWLDEKVLFHSCGNIHALVGDLIEIGVDVLNVNQLDVNGIDEIGERFAGQVCFFGGLDQQRILHFGSVEEVKQHVKHVIHALAGRDGGYIAVAGQGADAPVANVRATLKAFREDGTYPISTEEKT